MTLSPIASIEFELHYSSSALSHPTALVAEKMYNQNRFEHHKVTPPHKVYLPCASLQNHLFRSLLKKKKNKLCPRKIVK